MEQPRICIVGAGASGLSVGWYLRKEGFKDVSILEKNSRVGGKCDTFTYKNRAIDMGGVEITAGYRNIRELSASRRHDQSPQGPAPLHGQSRGHHRREAVS